MIPAVGKSDEVDRLVEEVRAGNRQRFAQLIDIFELPVRAVIAAMVPEPHVVDDLVNETFFTAFRKLDSYALGTDFRAWVKSIARNIALNERRRLFKQWGEAGRLDRLAIETTASPLVDQFSSLVAAETMAELQECLRELRDAGHRLVRGYYFEGRSVSDLADQEKRKESWVHLVLFRARAALAACLERRGVLPSG